MKYLLLLLSFCFLLSNDLDRKKYRIRQDLENFETSSNQFRNEEELINDISILPNVKAMAKETKDLGRETSFAIWSTEEAESYYYTKHYTHFIQEIEKEE